MKKFFTKKHSWTALLIGLFVTLFLSIFVTSFLEKALRIGQSVKSVEQSTQAYYQATSIIETQLNNNTELRKKPWTTTGSTVFSWFTGSILQVTSSGSSIPAQWKWNSRYDSNWNIISMDRPVQLVLNKDYFDNIKNGGARVFFRIPKIENLRVWTSIDSTYSSWIIYFSIWNASDIFYLRDDNLIDKNKILPVWSSNDSVQGFQSLKWIIYKNWIKQTDNNNYLLSFDIGNVCWDSDNYLCTFKISMINPVTINWNIIPFLEYKIVGINNIPLQFMELDSRGFAGKLIRQRKVDIPQITTNTALDFAVLQ